MNVSDLSKATGVSIHRLRRYEALGLILCQRSGAGYREFALNTVREVIFISMSRDLGFALKDLADALPSYRMGRLSIDDMVARMQTRMAQVDAQIADLQTLRGKLVSHIAWFKQREQLQLQKQAGNAAQARPARKASGPAQSKPQRKSTLKAKP